MKMNILISSKKQVILISLIFVIPLITLLIVYNIYSVNTLNHEMAKTAKSTLSLYQQNLEEDLSRIEILMSEYWANDSEHQQLLFPLDEITAHVNTLNILAEYKRMFNMFPSVGAFFICSNENNLYRGVYNEHYSPEIHDSMRKYIHQLTKNPMEEQTTKWYAHRIEDRYFLFRILGKNGAYSICMLDFERMIAPQTSINNNKGDFIMYASLNDNPLSETETVKQAGIELKSTEEDFYITGKKSRHFIVESYLQDANINMLYAVPYRSFLYRMSTIQVVVSVFSVLIMILIPLAYWLLKRSYFKPLQELTQTMKQIKDGDLNAKMNQNYHIQEFQETSKTFNSMMQQIKNLKVQSYEKELQKQQAQLQYMQLQIKSHFFLNCLKILYGMIEQEKYNTTQDIILGISTYIRYIFKDNLTLVPLQTEVQHVQNYIELQRYSMAQQIEYELDIDAELEDCEVPTLCIQTFVENSFKYAVRPNQNLHMWIKAKVLHSEECDYMDMVIQDNGDGFSEEWLQRLNQQTTCTYQESHVGIFNVKQRLGLLFGEKAAFCCMNNETGALCELIIPIPSKPEKEAKI